MPRRFKTSGYISGVTGERVTVPIELPEAIPEQVFAELQTWRDPESRPNLLAAQRDHTWNLDHLRPEVPKANYPMTAAIFEVFADLRQARDTLVTWATLANANPGVIDYLGRATVPIMAQQILLRMGLISRPVWGVLRAAFSSGVLSAKGDPDVDMVVVGDKQTPFGVIVVGNTPAWANCGVGTEMCPFLVIVPDAGPALTEAFKTDKLPGALVLATKVPRMVQADIATDGIATADVLSIHAASGLLDLASEWAFRRMEAGMYAPRV